MGAPLGALADAVLAAPVTLAVAPALALAIHPSRKGLTLGFVTGGKIEEEERESVLLMRQTLHEFGKCGSGDWI
jgi:hypothetical protein